MTRTMTVGGGDELIEFIDSLAKDEDYRIQNEIMPNALCLLLEKQARFGLQKLLDLLA